MKKYCDHKSHDLDLLSNIAARNRCSFNLSIRTTSGGTLLPNWQVANRPNFQTRTLPPRNYNFHHPEHGVLMITRIEKLATTRQIKFNLQLITQGRNVINGNCHLTVDNDDLSAFKPLQIGEHRRPVDDRVGKSSVGYADIDISSMRCRNIIYLVHHVFARSGSELGVAMFVVENIVNPALDHVCENCNMR